LFLIICISLSFLCTFVIQSISVWKKGENGREKEERRGRKEKERKREGVKEIATEKSNTFINIS